MRRAIFGLLLAVCTTGPALALSHLVPEEPAVAKLLPPKFPHIDDRYLETLSPVFDGSVRVFEVETGSPFPDGIIGLKVTSEGPVIFGAQPSGSTEPELPVPEPPPLHLMGTDGKLHLEPTPPARKSKPPEYHLNYCTGTIDAKTADRIARAWDSVLLETRPDATKPQFAADGLITHFGSNTTYRVLAGYGWDIDPGSRPAWLGRIGYDMMQICWKWPQAGVDQQAARAEMDQYLTKLESH